MATINIKFRPSVLENRQGSIYYLIIHNRIPRQIPSHFHIFPHEWNNRRSTINPADSEYRAEILAFIRENIRFDVDRIKRIINKLEDSGLTYSTDDIVSEFKSYVARYSLRNFMTSLIAKLIHNGKIRTSETYASALNNFLRFLAEDSSASIFFHDNDIMLDCINSNLIEAYEAWHMKRGNTPNTSSFYMRILRAVYNRALEDNIIIDRKPFRHVYTGVEKTVKRALPLGFMRKIKALDLTVFPTLDYARNMFLLSFMLRGMSFIDMAFLKKTDLKNGFISYRRRKTGQLLTIKWTADMQLILSKYPENKSQYLLPIIKNININERYAYRNAAYNINHNLKKIADMLHIGIPLTLYVARHSWASVARYKGIPISVISEGMGHDSETTTQIYLASLDTSAVDRANTLILSSL